MTDRDALNRSPDEPNDGWTCCDCGELQTGDPEQNRCDVCEEYICGECCLGHIDEDDDNED